MAKVSVVRQTNKVRYTGDESLRLFNGTIIVLCNSEKEVVKGPYVVTSFRSRNSWDNEKTNTYCSLVLFENGYIAFEEPCSRTTQMRRVMSHLLPNQDVETALKRGLYIRAIPSSSVSIEILLPPEE